MLEGFQDLDSIPVVIEKEIERQQKLIEKSQQPKEETRVAKEDGTTDFTRPLPGGERMYPETDLETFVVTKEFLGKIKIPETWEHKTKKLSKVLPKDMAEQIIKSDYFNLFEKLSKKADPVLVAGTFTSIIKDLKRKGINTNYLSDSNFEDLFSFIKDKKISKEAIPDVLEIVCTKKIPVKDALEKTGLESIDEGKLREIIRVIFKKNPNLVKDKRTSALMGEVMKQTRGKIDGKTVHRVLNEEINKV